MSFPTRPTGHNTNWHAQKYAPHSWREPEKPGDRDFGAIIPFRTCSYCGSIHPEDLLKALEGGAKLGGSDWKYGWPHKFYLDGIPHPHEDNPTITSRTSYVDENGVRQEKNGDPRPMGKAHGKWYNVHLLDEGYDPETLARLIDALEKHGGIRFEVEGTDLKYSAPHRGYQR